MMSVAAGAHEGDLSFDDVFDARSPSCVSDEPNSRPVSFAAEPVASLDDDIGSASPVRVHAPASPGFAGDELATTPNNTNLTSALLRTSSGRIFREPATPQRLTPDSFEILRVVGQGAFGKVYQVQKKDTGEVLAMKVMKKARILQRNHAEYMRTERDVLTRVDHPYIVTLRYSFQTPEKLYLLLDFINGGHLFFQLYRAGIFEEDLARIYTAEIVLALTHLHSVGIMHRDLKPENILLDSEGHVRLTDFGLAKADIDDETRTNSLCGTIDYMAPEIINAKGHGKAADWWSVGVLLFEMLTGDVPFRAKNRSLLQKEITSKKVKLPPYLTAEATNILKVLLERDQTKRLGAGPDGSAKVKAHKFFKPINWAKLERREIQPKFMPTVVNNRCVQNFDSQWTDMPAEESPAGTPPDPTHANVFVGFTYTRDSFLDLVEAECAARDGMTMNDKPASLKQSFAESDVAKAASKLLGAQRHKNSREKMGDSAEGRTGEQEEEEEDELLEQGGSEGEVPSTRHSFGNATCGEGAGRGGEADGERWREVGDQPSTADELVTIANAAAASTDGEQQKKKGGGSNHGSNTSRASTPPTPADLRLERELDAAEDLVAAVQAQARRVSQSRAAANSGSRSGSDSGSAAGGGGGDGSGGGAQLPPRSPAPASEPAPDPPTTPAPAPPKPKAVPAPALNPAAKPFTFRPSAPSFVPGGGGGRGGGAPPPHKKKQLPVPIVGGFNSVPRSEQTPPPPQQQQQQQPSQAPAPTSWAARLRG